MHQPETQPRPSIFYRYRVHPFRRPPELDRTEMDGAAAAVPVVVVGGGPIGMVAALELARHGCPACCWQPSCRSRRQPRDRVHPALDGDPADSWRHRAHRMTENGLPWRFGKLLLPRPARLPDGGAARRRRPLLPDAEHPAAVHGGVPDRCLRGQPADRLPLGQQARQVEQDATSRVAEIDTPEGPYTLESGMAGRGRRRPLALSAPR